MRRFVSVVGLLVGLMTVLVACGGGDSAATPAPAAQKVTVDLAEWTVQPSVVIAKAGRIEFTAANKGQLAHELVVVRTDVDHAGLVVVEDKANVTAAGTVIGQIEPEKLGPGTSASRTWDLAAGKHVLLCNVAGHYQGGMHVAFTVE